MVAIMNQTVSMGNFQAVLPSARSAEHGKGNTLESFNELVLEYQDQVYRQASWILGDEAAAEDAVQEAFIRAYQNLHAYNGGPFLPWILRITTNYCLDMLRRQKVRKSTSLEIYDEYDEEMDSAPWLRDTSGSAEDMLVRSETQAWIMKCIRRLSPEYQTAIILVDLQEMDYLQAAEIAGVCLGTFKSRLARAREQLQRYLRADPDKCYRMGKASVHLN